MKPFSSSLTLRPLAVLLPRAGLWLELIKALAVFGALAACLFGESELTKHRDAGDGFLSIRLCAADTQWMLFGCAAGYFAIFSCLQHFLRSGRMAFPRGASLFLLITLVMVTGAYLVDYTAASASPRALIFMFGVALGKGVEFWASSASPPIRTKRLFLRVTIPLLLILAATCVCNFGTETDFQYRGQARWTGIWSSPNSCGMLMGAGLVVAVAVWLAACDFQVFRTRRMRTVVLSALFVLAAVLGSGLLRTYCRGGWLGALGGLAYLAAWRMKQGFWGGLRRCWVWLSVIAMTVTVLAFWQFRHSEQHLARRSFSTANVNDTSWQNRVSGWEGSLQMMAAKPFFGTGWNHVNEVYDHFFLPAKLTDGIAIRTNDFALLGSYLGLPALLCFLGYIGWCLTRNFSPARKDAEGGEVSADLRAAQMMQAGCRGGAFVLLTGFWFDGGLFTLPTAATFWILLDLGRAQISGTNGGGNGGGRAPELPEKKSKPPVHFIRFFVAALLMLAGAIFWARSDDMFERHELRGVSADFRKPAGIAVVPKGGGRHPVIFYAHDGNDAWRTDGNVLRQFAELGFVAVGFDFDPETEAFERQFSSIVQQVKNEKWADATVCAWVGAGTGADAQMRYLLQHPDQQPGLVTRLGGGTAEVESAAELANVRAPFLLIHGEKDSTTPVESAQKLAGLLKMAGAPVTLKLIPGAEHEFGQDHAGVVRLTAEFCKAKLTPSMPQPEFARAAPMPFWLCLLPGMGWGLFSLWKWFQARAVTASEECAPRWRKLEWGLRFAAAVLVLLALAQTAFRLAVPRLPATDQNMAIARQSFVPAKWQQDFAALTTQPLWQGQKIKTVLENVELSHYTVNELINWKVDPDKYRDYVLSPVIADDKAELNWRRELWDNFYRRVRKENTPDTAAEIVVRFLRERVTVAPALAKQPGVETIWKSHLANTEDFEIIYTAALRSVGVPARLNTVRQVEFWNGTEWKTAPRPIAATWVG